MALIILSIMALMAAIGFTFAWFTTESRRQRDHQTETSPPPSSEVLSIAPARLAALGYMPAGIDAIAGIHIAELMARPETASILQLLRADQTSFGISRLEQMTGMRLEELDHVLLGLKMKEEAFGRIFLMVQTRQAYDAAKTRANLHAGREIQRKDKTVYHIALEQTELGAALWCAGPRTLVFALQPNDLDGIPAEPIAGVNRFSTDLQKLLTGLEAGTQAWVVGTSTNWNTLWSLLQLIGLLDGDQHALNQVHTFQGLLRCDQDVHGQIEAACTDEAGAAELDKYLARKGLEADYLEKKAAERPRTRALLEELARSLIRERKGERVHVQAKVSLESVRRSLPHRSIGARAAQ